MSPTRHATIALASDALAARVHESTAQALLDWQARWPLQAALQRVLPAQGDVPDGVAGRHEGPLHEREAGRAALLWWPSRLPDAMGAALFGSSAGRLSPDSTAARCARAAADALLDALARAWRVTGWDAAPGAPLEAHSRWQAPLDLHLAIAGVDVAARLPAQRFVERARVQAAKPLTGTATRDAFTQLTVPLEVVLGKAELSVSEIAGLQRGDVVLLDASLHDPLPVVIAGAPGDLHAWLGRVGQRRAVEFVQRSR